MLPKIFPSNPLGPVNLVVDDYFPNQTAIRGHLGQVGGFVIPTPGTNQYISVIQFIHITQSVGILGGYKFPHLAGGEVLFVQGIANRSAIGAISTGVVAIVKNQQIAIFRDGWGIVEKTGLVTAGNCLRTFWRGTDAAGTRLQHPAATGTPR